MKRSELIVASSVLVGLFFCFYLTEASPHKRLERSVGEVQQGRNSRPYESWDGKFYDNVVHDSRRFLDEEKLRAEADEKGPSKGLIVGIILGSVAACILIFCCIAICLCECMREMLCWVKNLLCCCCDED